MGKKVTLNVAWLLLVCISETADLLGFSHTTISRVYRENISVLWEKMPCSCQRSEENDNRKATETQIRSAEEHL